MPDLDPPSEQVARFRDEIIRLLGPEKRLGLAVSGGPDSLAMLLLAAAAFRRGVEVATVDHRLRPESASEAAAVRDLSGRLGVPHAILAVDVAGGGAGLQGEARRARYAVLGAWATERGLAGVATAHHANDQAETILMRLKRGSGVAGLSGIRPVHRQGQLLVVRPLLGWTRSDLAAIVASAGLTPADDPSNRDERFDRTVVRGLLAAHPEFEARRLARSAAALREADEAIEWAIGELAATRIAVVGGERMIDPGGLPREILRRLLRRAVEGLRRENGLAPEWRGGEDVEGLLASLEKGGSGTLAGVMACGGTRWRVRLAPARRKSG